MPPIIYKTFFSAYFIGISIGMYFFIRNILNELKRQKDVFGFIFLALVVLMFFACLTLAVICFL